MIKENGKYVRPHQGAKRIAPINMRKNEHQFVIDGFLIEEVLKQIPSNIKILQAYVCLIKRGVEKRMVVSNHLRKLGVTTINQIDYTNKATLIFDEITREIIINNVKKVCQELNFDYEKAYFGYIVLSNGEATGKFTHTTKEVHPDERDLRKKLRVLGLVLGSGKVQSLVTDLGAKKFTCSIKEEIVKMVMCSR